MNEIITMLFNFVAQQKRAKNPWRAAVSNKLNITGVGYGADQQKIPLIRGGSSPNPNKPFLAL